MSRNPLKGARCTQRSRLLKNKVLHIKCLIESLIKKKNRSVKAIPAIGPSSYSFVNFWMGDVLVGFDSTDQLRFRLFL